MNKDINHSPTENPISEPIQIEIDQLLKQLSTFETDTMELADKTNDDQEKAGLFANYLIYEKQTYNLIEHLLDQENANEKENPAKEGKSQFEEPETQEGKDIENERAKELVSIISGKAGADQSTYNSAVNQLKRVHTLEYQAISSAGHDRPQQLQFRIKMSANSPYINIRHMDFVNRHNVKPISRSGLLDGRLNSQDGTKGRQFARSANYNNNSRIAQQLDARPDLQLLTLLHMMGNGGKNRKLGWQTMLVNRNSMLETLKLTREHTDIGTYPELETSDEMSDDPS